MDPEAARAVTDTQDNYCNPRERELRVNYSWSRPNDPYLYLKYREGNVQEACG